MPEPEAGAAKKKRTRRQRSEIVFVFDPAQKVPQALLNDILYGWLFPTLVDQFLEERGITRQALEARYLSPRSETQPAAAQVTDAVRTHE